MDCPQCDSMSESYGEAVANWNAAELRAIAAEAAVERVRALADYFQFAVASNEITAAWVTDIRSALAGDRS